MPVSANNNEEEEEDLLIKDEEIRASAPLIPDEVYKQLPAFFAEAMKAACNKRERNILLLDLFANLSG